MRQTGFVVSCLNLRQGERHDDYDGKVDSGRVPPHGGGGCARRPCGGNPVWRNCRGYRRQHPTPEDVFWLVEYAQTSLSKDLDDKKRLYADAGIPEYWVVNLRDGTLIVFRQPADGAYRFEQALSQGEIIPLAFPDTVVSVDKLL